MAKIFTDSWLGRLEGTKHREIRNLAASKQVISIDFLLEAGFD